MMDAEVLASLLKMLALNVVLAVSALVMCCTVRRRKRKQPRDKKLGPTRIHQQQQPAGVKRVPSEQVSQPVVMPKKQPPIEPPRKKQQPKSSEPSIERHEPPRKMKQPQEVSKVPREDATRTVEKPVDTREDDARTAIAAEKPVDTHEDDARTAIAAEKPVDTHEDDAQTAIAVDIREEEEEEDDDYEDEEDEEDEQAPEDQVTADELYELPIYAIANETSKDAGPLKVTPGQLSFPPGGGHSELTISNSGNWAQAVMFMSEQTEAGRFSVRPSACFIDAGDSHTFSVTRSGGGSARSKLVVITKRAPLDEEDAHAVFRNMPERERIKSDRADIPVTTY